MTWHDVHQLAIDLATADGEAIAAAGEARLRAAIGRAYYAALCIARDAVEQRTGLRAPKTEVHHWVRGKLKDYAWRLGLTHDRARNLARDMECLARLRVAADYRVAEVTMASVTHALDLAKAVIGALP